MGDVVILGAITTLDLTKERVLKAALENDELENVIIIGILKGGDTYFASGYADHREVLWRIEAAKRVLFESGDEQNDQ